VSFVWRCLVATSTTIAPTTNGAMAVCANPWNARATRSAQVGGGVWPTVAFPLTSVPMTVRFPARMHQQHCMVPGGCTSNDDARLAKLCGRRLCRHCSAGGQRDEDWGWMVCDFGFCSEARVPVTRVRAWVPMYRQHVSVRGRVPVGWRLPNGSSL
jgi:hypothetical protein